MFTLKLTYFKLLALWLTLAIAITGCKSNVKEEQKLVAKNVINIDSFKINSHDPITQDGIKGSTILAINYSMELCMSEEALGQKVDRRVVEIEGVDLKSNITTPGGCVFWEQKLDFSYHRKDRCKVFKTNIHLKDSGIKKEFSYSIDLLNHTVADLSRVKGCTLQMEQDEKIAQERQEQRRDKNGVAPVTRLEDEVLVLRKIVGVWTGDRGLNGTPRMRSDVRYLEFGTKITSCIKTQLDGENLKWTDINVKIQNDLTGDVVEFQNKTDEDGCFENLAHFKFEQYSYSKWIKNKMTVTVAKGHLEGYQIAQEYFVNPWEPRSRSFFISAQDRKNFKEGDLVNPDPQYNRLSVDGIMYILIGNDLENFKVNNYLSLTTSKTYQIVLNPRVNRGHRFSMGANTQYEKLHDGKFKLKFMILAPDRSDIEINENNYKNFTYLTGAEEEVEVKDGIINTLIKIPVKMVDLPRIAMRTVTVFKLEPIEKDIGLRNTVVTGFFKAKIPWIKTNVLQAKALQDNSNAQQTDQPTSHQGFNDVLSQAIKGKSAEELKTIHNGVVNKDDFQSIATEDNVTDSINKKKYKQHIEKLFANIKNYRDNTIYGNPSDVYVDENPLEIYKAQLLKDYGEVSSFITSTMPDSEEGKQYQLEEGDITSLYDHDYTSKDQLVHHPSYKKITTILCHRHFPVEDKGTLNKLLSFVTTKRTDRDECLKDPSKYFDLFRSIHSRHIENTYAKHSIPLSLSIGSHVRTFSSDSKTVWSSKRIGADLGLKLPMGDIFGSGVRLFEYSKGWTENQSSGFDQSDNVSQNLQVLVEKFTIEVEGRFQKCVTVAGKNYVPVAIKDKLKNSGRLSGKSLNLEDTKRHVKKKVAKAYYFCDFEDDLSLDESWYYLQAYTPSYTLLMDSFGPTEIKFIKVIRGDSNYKQMTELFKDETRNYVIERRVNSRTPDEKLIQDWSHLIKTEEDPSSANKLLINNFESAIPGAIMKSVDMI